MTKQNQVGYQKPPSAHQWQPGQSGNPSGKKKAHKIQQPLPEMFASHFYETALMSVAGKKKKMTMADALVLKMLHNLINAPIKSQVEALKVLAGMGIINVQSTPWEAEYAEDSFTEEHRRLLEITQRAMAGFDDDEEGYEYDEESCEDDEHY